MNWFKGKRIVFALTTIIFSLLLSAPVRAEESFKLYIDSYVVEDGQLGLYINHNQDKESIPNKENIEVKFGAQKMVTDEIISFSETDQNVSYKCVIDVSGSMSQDRIDLAKKMIKLIARKKKPKDNLAITAMGNDLVQSEYMTDVDEISKKADLLTLSHDDTNLYYSIVEELRGMQTSSDVHNKRCLIIFSDGAEDQATGITREEAEKEVEDSHIPIFTVALLKNGYSEADKESAKILGSFARRSSGGMHFAPDLGVGEIESIPDMIMNTVNHSIVLKENLDDIEVSGKEVVLKVTVTNEDGQIASDEIKVPEGDIKLIQKEQDKISEEKATESDLDEEKSGTEEEDSNTEEDVSEEQTQDSTILGMPEGKFYLLFGIATGLVLLVIVIFVVKKKRKKKAIPEKVVEDNSSAIGENELSNYDMGGFGKTVFADDSSATEAFGDTSSMEDNSITEAISGFSDSFGMGVIADTAVNVSLICLGRGEDSTYKLAVSGSYPIGRSSSLCKLAFPDDAAMSGHHCSLINEGKRLFIKDNNSTNGTFVNGVPISGRFELNQDDTIMMGSYEYRVTWE